MTRKPMRFTEQSFSLCHPGYGRDFRGRLSSVKTLENITMEVSTVVSFIIGP